MGIPSYFSYILKNHKNIIKKITNTQKNNLYLDSNSIIYDCLRKTSDKRQLFDNICLKIEEYIHNIKPNKRVFIAFDGVAPVAKLEQQRNRRYKSYLEKKIRKVVFPNEPQIWDTTVTTPGTTFMKDLSKFVLKHFENKVKTFGI